MSHIFSVLYCSSKHSNVNFLLETSCSNHVSISHCLWDSVCSWFFAAGVEIVPDLGLDPPVNWGKEYSLAWPHTRTVVRECCKGDDQSQWRRANFDPPPPLSPLTIFPKIGRGDYVGDIYHHAKFYSNRIRGFASAHARLRTSLLTRLSFLGVLEITYSQDATTDIDAKYVKRRGSVQECAFWGSQNHTLTSTPPFSPKNRHFGARL